MWIRSIRAKNFLSIRKEIEVNFNGNNIIVGPNNVGKTNLFRVIDFVRDVLSGRLDDSTAYYYNSDFDNPFEVGVSVSFNTKEMEALSDFFVCSSIMDFINPRSERLESPQDTRAMLYKVISTKYGRDFVKPLFNNVTLEVLGQAQENCPCQTRIRITAPDENVFFIHPNRRITRNPTASTNHGRTSLLALLLDDLEQKFPEEMSSYLKDENKTLPDFNYKPENIFSLMYDRLESSKSISIDIGEFNFKDYNSILADIRERRRLSKFLRPRGFTADVVDIFSVIIAIYKNSIIRTANVRTKPRAFLSQETFAPGITHISQLSGEELPSILFRLKNSSIPEERKMHAEVVKHFREINGGLEFDVGIRSRELTSERHGELAREQSESGEPTDFVSQLPILPNVNLVGVQKEGGIVIAYELMIQIFKDDLVIPLELSAAGIFESLILLVALLGHRQKTILLDEPALNLHPSMQMRMQELMKKAIKADNQLVVITHSPYLLDVEELDSIWRFFKEDDSTTVINMEKSLQEIDKEDKEKIVRQFRSSDVRSILFSNGVILVEGPSDKIVIEKLDRQLALSERNGANIEENEWNLIEMGSKNNLATFIRLTSNLHILYVCVMDNDALMHCEKTLEINNKKILTSAIPYHLHRAKLLSTDDLQTISGLSENIKECNGKKMYEQDSRKTLLDLAKRYGVFVFSSNLEDVLQNSVGKKDSKPHRALDTISKRISEDSIPQELYEMMKFISETISKSKLEKIS